MKNLDNYITERLKLTSDSLYTCKPKDKFELMQIIEDRLKQNKDADLNDIDVSKITDMSYLFWDFADLDPHNIKIDKWDVGNVTKMNKMFYNCKNINVDVSEWDVSSVKDMELMFNNCQNFDSDLSGWNVSKVEYMKFMFYNCGKFKGKGLEKWNTKNVKEMEFMFDYCYSMDRLPNWYND